VSIEFICFSIERVVSCEHRKCKKMVFPAAIREKSQRGVALSCDAHVMFASSGKIRQPCTFSLSDPVLVRDFLISQHFCAGKLEELHSSLFSHLVFYLMFVSACVSVCEPPDPMNHVKIIKCQPRTCARSELVPNWYKKILPDHIDQAEINKSTMLSNKSSTA